MKNVSPGAVSRNLPRGVLCPGKYVRAADPCDHRTRIYGDALFEWRGSMKRPELLAYLAEEIHKRKSDAEPLRVGIDGRCASGKTLLADALVPVLTSLMPEVEILRPSVDGFHHTRERRYQQGEYSAIGYYEDAYDYQAVIECLLGPLSGGIDRKSVV